jgi:hypothetical protein
VQRGIDQPRRQVVDRGDPVVLDLVVQVLEAVEVLVERPGAVLLQLALLQRVQLVEVVQLGAGLLLLVGV